MGEVGTMAALLILVLLSFASVMGESPVIDDCVEPTPSCPENEEYRCQNPCPPETCVTLYAAFLCIENQTCNQGCFCKSGFLRTTTNGTCVPRDQCLPLECVNDPNAQRGCGIRCGKTCEDYKDKSKICAKGPCKLNGCDCKPGFVYDKNLNKCVKPNECTKQCTKLNERYSECLLGECVPRTCKDLGKPLACPDIAAPCAGGCICDTGYVRDCNGNCIDAKTCPSCGGDPNAQSGCGNPCGKTCDSRGVNKSELVCPQYCDVNGCDCKDGYLLNTDTKKCVLIKDCPKPPNQCGKNEEYYCGPACPEASCDIPKPPLCPSDICEHKCYCKKGFVRDANKKCVPIDTCPQQCKKPNERYTNCLLGECVPKTCDDLGKPIACAAVAAPCAGGCICAEGFVRNSNGDCIEQTKCPSCGGDPNAQSGCGNPCGKTCDSRGINKSELVCPQYCKVNGCDCKPGFFLDTDLNKCVPEKSCPKPQQCKNPNERYSKCLLGECVPKTCDDLGLPIACPAIANPCAGGCICVDGFVRNSNGTCIEKAKCPSCGGDPNAIPGCGNPCGKTCASRAPNAPRIACPLYCRADGCDCKKGFLLDTDSNKCVPEQSCPKPQQCKNPNERYSTCLLGECVPKTCDDLGLPIACPAIAKPCAGGCICVDGFVRNSNGTCIEKAKCPSCGGDPNAIPGCGNPCGKTCASRAPNAPRIACPLYCRADGCDCKKGFLLDTDSNKCVPEQSCPKPKLCLKPNERYSNCLLGECVPRTCDDLGKPIACAAIAGPCAGGCVCAAGFVRNSNGLCIEQTKCPSCGGDPNAQSGCGNPCGKTCDSRGVNKSELVCPQYCEVNGCDCKDGYLLNTDTKKCVLIKDCPKPPNQCDKNEEYYCGPACPEASCDIPKPPICTSEICKHKCYCKKGFVRDANKKCVPIDTCPSNQCGKNEEYYCGPSCPEASCDNPNPPICINKKCELKCYCKKGFVRNASKECVPIDTCPVTCNKPNERYIDCLAGQCLPKTCDDLGRSLPCPFIVGPCPGGCICEEGYLRNAKGTCVKIEQCPPKPCGANETWISPCNSPCNNQLCPRNDKETPPCEPIKPCYPGCQCKLNFRLNATRQCILAPDCPSVECTRQNEVWNSCPSACLAENCEDINNQPKTCNTLIWLCSPRCICKKGHFRNKDGLCIPAAQCPVKCTKPNEKYIDCLAGQCNPKTCKELQVPAPCPRVKPPCPGGCICVDGFVRDDTGACIKKENCPLICNGPNEQSSTCANKLCTPTTCKDVVKMPYCPPPNPGPCTNGCVCNRGFVRSSNGTCIAIKDCPQAGTCASKNETWVQCAANCAPAYCPTDDQPQPVCFLPAGLCQPGCHCKPNYRINKDNQCILASECPEVPCTRPNEIFSSCPGNRIMTCAALGTTPVPNSGPIICNPGCVCKKGFYKNDNGTCVAECECPTDSSDD